MPPCVRIQHRIWQPAVCICIGEGALMSDNSQQGFELVGQKLGQYEIKQQLGQGGMATVYLAYQPSIDRTVAIKVMPKYFMHDPSFLQRFEREVRVIAKLQHPRIVPVYDYGQIEGQPYIVMAYMPGGTLTDKIKLGPMQLPEVVRLIEQIAEGLDHAHHEGVIHRDFKPSNVLLDKGGNAHLADFGIAKISESTVALTGSGVVGTPAYMAPEMASEGIVTTAVDVYALGVTLYQMLTGKYPFQGDTPLRVMMAHATEPVPSVLVDRPDLPRPVADVVQRAMAKDPADRFPTPGDLAKALRAAVEGRPVEAAPARAAASGITQTVIETPVTPPPSTTPPPPSQSAPGYTPSPNVIGSGAYPTTEKKGCSTPMIIGGVVGALALICIALAALGALASIGPLASILAPPTATPRPTRTPRPTERPTEVPTDTPTPVPPTPVPQVEDGLVFVNDIGGDICYLFISDSSSLSWGNDQLGETQILHDNEQYEMVVPPGTYNLMAQDCSYNILWTAWEVQIGSQRTEVQISSSPDSLEITNNRSDSVCEVYISPTSSSTWGMNWIELGTPIDPGATRTFALPQGGVQGDNDSSWDGSWDLFVRTCAGQDANEERNVQLVGNMFWELS